MEELQETAGVRPARAPTSHADEGEGPEEVKLEFMPAEADLEEVKGMEMEDNPASFFSLPKLSSSMGDGLGDGEEDEDAEEGLPPQLPTRKMDSVCTLVPLRSAIGEGGMPRTRSAYLTLRVAVAGLA